MAGLPDAGGYDGAARGDGAGYPPAKGGAPTPTCGLAPAGARGGWVAGGAAAPAPAAPAPAAPPKAGGAEPTDSGGRGTEPLVVLLATLPGPLCTLDADTRRRWVRTTGAEHSHDRSLRVLNASWVREWWTTCRAQQHNHTAR